MTTPAKKIQKRNDDKALNYFLYASGLISSNDRAAAIIELRKGIRIASPDLRAELAALLAQVQQVMATGQAA